MKLAAIIVSMKYGIANESPCSKLQGISRLKHLIWIPAFAGMTVFGLFTRSPMFHIKISQYGLFKIVF
jgi:hypothetical protein